MTQQEAVRVLDMAREGQPLPTELVQIALSITEQIPRPENAERYELMLDALRRTGLL